VVHGPLIATLLVDLLTHHLAGRAIAAFSYRAVSPCFDGALLRLDAAPPDGEGRSRAWASGPDSALIMEVEAMIR
jgi:3-methylfumaryl-CoA hydratase